MVKDTESCKKTKALIEKYFFKPSRFQSSSHKPSTDPSTLFYPVVRYGDVHMVENVVSVLFVEFGLKE